MKILSRVTLTSGMIMAMLGSMAFGDLYTGWSNYQDYVMNPNAAGITANVVKFPVLIRLTSANSAIFGSPNSPADLRFAKGGNLNVGYPYQVQRWDATDKLAEIWILVDTIFSGPTSQSIRMYWGNSTASAESNGPGVFNAVSGYTSVWHLNDTTDACDKLPMTGSAKPTAKVSGIIDSSFTFNGTSNYLFAADSTSANSAALNFPNGGPYTMSAWEYDANATHAERIVASKGNTNWDLKMGGTQGNFEIVQYIQSPAGWAWDTNAAGVPAPSTGTWHHIVGVRNNAGTSPSYADSFYVDGILVASSVKTSTSGTYSGAHAVCIGKQPDVANQFWNGNLNEVEISNVARSADWIKLCYMNQQSGQSFILPNPGALNATIYNISTNATISGATVQMTSGGSQSQTTNGSGVAAFSGLLAETYVFSVTAPGYFPDTGLSVTIFLGQTTYVGWFLTPILPPSAPSLVSPTDGATIGTSTAPNLTWSASIGAVSYRLQASLSSTFSPVIFDQSGITGTSLPISGLPQGVSVYWHVNAANTSGSSIWSDLWSFKISATAVFLQNNASYSKSIVISNSGITYELPAASSVYIALYDMRGRQVRQLMNGLQNAGLHAIDFKRAKITAGYYVVEFKAGGFIMQKKLALID